MTAFTVVIDHPDAEKLLRAAIEGYAKVTDAHAGYTLASQPREGESTQGRKRRAQILTERAEACRNATITPGGQAG